MEELVRYLACKLVDHPDEVEVTSHDEDGAMVVELKVAPSDMGKVIGKQGRIAKALRAVVRASAALDSQTVLVDILDRNEEE